MRYSHRMHRLLLTWLLLSAAAGATEVYRWVENGQVHYSDRPQEDAERVELKDRTTAFETPAARSRSGREAPAAADAGYESLEIVSPGQEEVLWNIGGRLDVTLSLQPSLQRGHRLELFLDDKPVPVPGGNRLRVTVPDVYRGVHVLKARVVGRNGRVLIESEPRTFAVQQTSILNPNNPNAPGSP
ncbi:MAG: DUF4124 domain-containing protein [Gammaproteobacteria bacterium]|nr:MAG: DUF4124 domain-containing protein [Gammaproteobacteria bacterium]